MKKDKQLSGDWNKRENGRKNWGREEKRVKINNKQGG